MNESYQLALGALAVVGTIVSTVIGGYILLAIKSARARAAQDVAQVGIDVEAESNERRREVASIAKQLQESIDREGELWRKKTESLGRDISKIRERLAYDRGVAGKTFREREDD